MPYSTRANLIGILVQAKRPLKAGEVIRFARCIGLSPENTKSHLTRMVAEGIIQRNGTRRLATYRPSPEQMIVIHGIQARLQPQSDQAWNGKWLILTPGPSANRQDKARIRTWLWFDGFRPVAPGVFVRPSWPIPWAKERALQYAGIGPGALFEGECIGKVDDLTRLYDLTGLDSEARRITRWIERRISASDSPRKAFVESMRVGGRMAHFIGHDPRLPDAIWGQRSWVKTLIRTFQKFERRLAPHVEIFVREEGGKS